MKHDGKIDIAVGMSAKSKLWRNRKMLWSDLVEKLLTANKTTETQKEYAKSTKAERSKIKDVGGYVGGYLRNGKRSPANVVHRQLITLDLDYSNLNFWDDFRMEFGEAAVLHATHSHTKRSPRYRLIMPLDREVSVEEYVAISRQVAGRLSIELFDNTTFEVNRLMFWPSSSKDVKYYAKFQDGKWLDADAILDSYIDWKDSSLWPTSQRLSDTIKGLSEKQEDPNEKRGVVGAFCRSYSITEAIEAFLQEEYTEAAENRYTYLKGSTAGGLVLYEDLYAYSHHGTDPAGGTLSNSFDLVRRHKFGHLDLEHSGKSKAPSTKAMEAFARNDNKTKRTIAEERINEARYDFKEDVEEEDFEEEEYEKDILVGDLGWAEEMEVNHQGKYLSSATNLNLIFENDRRLKKAFKFNEFNQKRYVFKSLPWRKIKKPEPIRNVDYSGIRNYIEAVYGIAGIHKIEDALSLEFQKWSFHPIKEYLESLEWDGKPRVDKLLVKYFEAEDTTYVREAIRKPLVAAVSRVFTPGIKFDLVLTLVGEQGTGKSTFIDKLGRGWTSDTFTTVHGKESFEQLQGSWLIEIAELSGLRNSEVETVKHFISKREDTFRPAYGRTIETFKRQCVFFGTTNKREFLSDPSGNRRFMPVDVNLPAHTNLAIKMTKKTVDQIWAEVMEIYIAGEKLTLSERGTKQATKEQIVHSTVDHRAGVIQAYLDTPIPKSWDSYGLLRRRDFLRNEDELATKKLKERQYVCIAEIWCECLGKDKNEMTRYKTRELNDIMRNIPDWVPFKSPRRFSLYGMQRYYMKVDI